jgi:hypothetical protein
MTISASFQGFRKSVQTDSAVFTGLLVIGVCIAVVALLAAVISWQAFVTMTLWNWFLVPFLHLPVMTLYVAMGVTLTFTAIRGSNYRKTEPGSGALVYALVALAAPALQLGFGYLFLKLI